MTGLGRSRSSISVPSFPLCRFVTLRPTMVASLVGWPLVRVASSSRSPSASRAARRSKIRWSQYSNLGEEQPILAAGGPPLGRREERREGPQARREPVMLVETRSGRERKVGAQAHEHSAPVGVVQARVVLVDPLLRVLQMPAIVFADRRKDSRRFTPFHDDRDLIGLRPVEGRVDEFIAPTRRRLHDRGAPRLRVSGNPDVKLLRNVSEHRD